MAANEILGFTTGEAIDLPGLKFVAGAKATITDEGLVAVRSGNFTDLLGIDQPGTFKAENDRHGGTEIVVVAPREKPAAQPALADQGSQPQAIGGDSFDFKQLTGHGDSAGKFELSSESLIVANLGGRQDIADGAPELAADLHHGLVHDHDFML